MEKLKGAGRRTYNVIYEDMKRFLHEKQYEFDLTTTHHINIELTMFKRTLPLFFSRNWLVLKATQGSGGFITSDHPVLLTWADPEMHKRGRAPILTSQKSDLIVPISHHLTLIGSFELEEGELDITEEMVATVNARVIGSSHRQVYAHDLNFTYVRDDQFRKGAKLCEDPHFIRARPRSTSTASVD